MIVVVGSGGNGQTYFMEFLKINNVSINDTTDKDGLKHLSTPEKLKQKNIFKSVSKCIFLYNEPCKAIASFFRKKWHWNQMKKLENPYNLKKNEVADLNTFCSLVKEKGNDLFGIEHQFEKWLKNDLEIPIYFLDFNDILKDKEKLNLFVGEELDYKKFKNLSFMRNLRFKHSNIENDVIEFYKELYRSIKIKGNKYNNSHAYS